MLRELDVPCLVYAGNADDRAHASAEQSVEDTRNTSCVSVPGPDHLQGMSRIDVVLPHVKKLWHAFSRESYAGLFPTESHVWKNQFDLGNPRLRLQRPEGHDQAPG